MQIETARPSDTSEIAAIYGHHVRCGTASFEYDPPDESEIAQRLGKVIHAGWPWLVARDSAGTVLGYASASQFRDRAAYRFTCENSVYIHPARQGQGIGTALLRSLIDAAERAGFRQMIAVIGGAEPASVALHTACGFTHAGRMRAIGRKHGRWLDTVYMQRALGPGDDEPAENETP